MKITFISDTHGLHNQLHLGSGEMLIHAGDVSNRGAKHEVEEFINWFADLDFEHKIFIAGNHDFYFEKASDAEVQQLIPDGVVYLNDSGIKINDKNIWGSPVQPWFYDWAFNRKRGAELKKHWDLIPENTDMLITHGPPLGILDKTTRGEKVGCEDLLHAVDRIQPKIHVFGHIHEDYGMKDQAGTQFINASVLNERYRMVNSPIELDFI